LVIVIPRSAAYSRSGIGCVPGSCTLFLTNSAEAASQF
jgi:hypothetical protein